MLFKCKEGENRKDSHFFFVPRINGNFWQKLIQKYYRNLQHEIIIQYFLCQKLLTTSLGRKGGRT